ncbi:hybrid sensor histidine kinase/response regulator [Geomonas oryzae]|uniref:hybrid sensor histidine kinase/response regulator n=1 Tax=Geomonas oryzae TaxID=2364273 RepID=UPI00100B0672|nr:response regulator [Geomonas oryzae]
MSDHEALLKELLATFAIEAQEHLDALSSHLLALEREEEEAGRQRLLEGVFRRVHTLKGAAHAVNLVDVAHDCQELEEVLAGIKRGEAEFGVETFDLLHREINRLSARIFPAGAPTAAPAPAPQGALQSAPPSPLPTAPAPPVVAEATAQAPASAQPRPAAPVHAADETVRVSARLLETLLLQSEELVSAKLAASVLQEELSSLVGEVAERSAERDRALAAARRAMKKGTGGEASLAGLLEQGCRHERTVEGRLRLLEKNAEKQTRSLQALVDPLLEEMKKLQLLPCASILDPFAKLVRDLTRELGKEADFSLSGGELEFDRRILAELKEPLLHLVRNTVDHGIELPEIREASGKPRRGTVSVEVRLQDANRAELVLSDDGCGIDIEQVKRSALRRELATDEALARMSDSEALQFIFESGLSTSGTVGSISGRGVGLAIVRETLERLGGHVTVTSMPGAGTTFRLVFPLSFARMRALLVQVAGRDCAIPATVVELSARVPLAEVKRVENRDTVVAAGEVRPLVSLAGILETGRRSVEPDATVSYVILRAADRRIAFAVDQVLGVQEILVKPLGRQLSRVRNVAGATVLGSGRVVPVLNVADLFRSALGSGAAVASLPVAKAPARRARVSVLVAEDSITSRTLLKNILEASGFLVRTAVDGADAMAQLKTEPCDVVVSDIEMPRMDGFELTRSIRADAKLASLPVILVTGLESRTDRERGIDVGASAYLVKSSFDQTNLIEVIQKLT